MLLTLKTNLQHQVLYSGFATNPRLDLDLTASKLGSCISESGTSNIILNVSNDG